MSFVPLLPHRTPSRACSSSLSLCRLWCRSKFTRSSKPPITRFDSPGWLPRERDAEEAFPLTRLKQLEDRIDPRLYRALSTTPFKIDELTKVQSRVFSLLPRSPDTSKRSLAFSHDLLVKAKTGTGKTLAFLVPAIQARLAKLEKVATQAQIDGQDLSPDFALRCSTAYARRTVGTLIVSPTKELAVQLAREATKLTTHVPGFEVHMFVGGMSRQHQMSAWMRARRDLAVATPGRLIDLLSSEPEVTLAFKDLQTLILDEADLLIDMGFRDEMTQLCKYLALRASKGPRTMLFSATVYRAVQQIAQSYLRHDAELIDCVPGDQDAASPSQLQQDMTVLGYPKQQLPHILRLLAIDQLKHPENSKVIIFLATTKMTQLYASLLRELVPATLPSRSTRIWEIHSQNDMSQRRRASEGFRLGGPGNHVLVTSDVSARGLDYPDVTRVIQVGIPNSETQYVHRVGRTGRAGKAGQTDLVILPWELGFVTWTLTDFPLRPVTLADRQASLEALCKEHDEDRTSWLQQHNLAKSPFRDNLIELPGSFETAISELLPRLDPVAIQETCMSLISYYYGKHASMRCSRDSIVNGCKTWAVDACGMREAPSLTDELLRRTGFSPEVKFTKLGGVDLPPRPNGQGAPQWRGRGSKKTKRKSIQYWP